MNTKVISNFKVAGAVFLGLLGESFLARREEAWTLWAGLTLLALSIGLLFFRSKEPSIPEPAEKPAPFPFEWAWITVILALGVFFRWYQLDRIPSGIFLDQGNWGWAAERILYDGWRPLYDGQWRPFYVTHPLAVWELLSYYQLAFWFWLFEPSRISLFSFSNFLSLLGALGAFLAFRQWGDKRAALLALFFMVTLRWYLNFCRCAHPAFDAPVYLCAFLALWLYAHRTDRLWAWIICAVLLACGLYAYPSLLISPLLAAIWAFYEWRKNPPEGMKLLKRYALAAGVLLLLSFPVWMGMLVQQSFGKRLEEDWFFHRVSSEGWPVVWNHLTGFMLMFNRQGDGWPIHNWPYYRTLDSVTGLLFLWGIIRAVKRWKERRFFYCLSGLFVMALPGLLTSADAPASHTTGMIPFLAYLCAAAFMDLWNSLHRTSPVSKTIAFFGAFVLLAWMAGSNFYDYFSRQARDPAVCSAFYPGATAVGERLNRAKEKGVFLSPKFFRNNNVEFLNYRQSAAFQRLDFWNLPGKGDTVIGEDSIFVLDEGKTGLLKLLQFVFPGGTVEKYEYFKGWPLVYFYRVKAGTSRLDTPSEGIRGTYRLSRGWESSPAFTRADPVLNFTFRNDFNLTNFPPLSIRWEGRFSAENKGEYVFRTLTTDSSALWVDGKKVLEGLGSREGRVLLAPGRHSIRVEFQKLEGKDTAFTLLWLPPGAKGYQVVPFWSFKP